MKHEADKWNILFHGWIDRYHQPASGGEIAAGRTHIDGLGWFIGGHLDHPHDLAAGGEFAA
jgi:hypothetical protein